MTVDELIAEAWRQRTKPIEKPLALADISKFLRMALECLLEDIDYEARPASGSAVTARILATIITNCDEIAAGGQSSTFGGIQGH